MIDLLIQNCDILSIVNDQTHIDAGQDIAIRGNLITAIEPAGMIEIGEKTRLLQAHGLLAIPGLINAHAHVPMVLFRGLVEDVSISEWFNDHIWPLESNLTADDVYWGTMLGLAEMIESGITYVADHYFHMDQVAQAVEHSGIRANLAWAVFEQGGEAKLDETCEFITRWQDRDDGRITTWLGPHAPYTAGPEFLKIVAQRAQDLNVGIHIHVSETAEQVQHSQKQYGVTPVQMLEDTGVLSVPTILAHCLYPTIDDILLLSKYPSGIAHSPKTYLKLGMGTAPVSRFREAGIPVGLATDGAVSSNTLDILEQLRLLALSQKNTHKDSTAMPVADALDIAFHGASQVIRMSETLGDIAPRKLADIVLLRQDGIQSFPRYDPGANLVYSSRASEVQTVICNGKILMHDRQLLTIDKDLVKVEVAKRLDRLSQRVPGNRIATYPV